MTEATDTRRNMEKTLTKNCAVCEKSFAKPLTCSKRYWAKRKNCSKECQNKYWIGKENGRKRQGTKNSVPAWNKGMASPYFEEKSPTWKGENVSYSGIHKWVAKWKGTPSLCEKCGRTDLSKRSYHWANVDHQYKRILDEFIRLCVNCHIEYDKEHGLR